jgi:transcriptional regulator with XRE-family HTH domain
MMEESVYSPQKAAGVRVRLLRQALDLSRRELSEKYKERHGGLSAENLKNWEEGRLTAQGAEKLQKVFKDENVDVTIEWLLHGFGDAPNILKKRILADQLAGVSSHALNHELSVFHQLHKEAISTMVNDDGMAPYLQPGYHVAGIKLYGKDIRKAMGLPSIVQLKSGQKLIRNIEEGTTPNHYTLTCTNALTTVEKPTIENAELYSAAPIIWIRKPEITS